ncbi:MAG: radical SAM protein, partial [Acetatifactor sp.]|nr:radical SAM protein [Acetatifactor sp.]
KYIRTYGNQYVIDSPNSNRLMRLFHQRCGENGILHNNDQIFEYLHRFEQKQTATQLSLWDGLR